jgi:hypothetical protein
MNHHGHCGDLGDIIWALPTIRATGGGTLYLVNNPGRMTFPMTQDRANAIRPLLLQQPYITDVLFAGNDTSHVTAIDGFRDHCHGGRNLADAHLATHGLPFSHRNHPWLRVDTVEDISPVAFSCTARYQNDQFPWQRMVEEYGRHAVFLGTQDEHTTFVSRYGNVPYVQTDDLLQAARIIAGSRLFISNQGCLHSIAEGLKCNTILAVCPHCPTCIFNRMGAVHAWNEHFELPELPHHQLRNFKKHVPIQGIDDAVCITLERRSERWRLFSFRATEAGLGFIRKHAGIDGNNLALPEALHAYKGAYGRLHSHADVYRQAIQKGQTRLLVVEDDCVFTCDIAHLRGYLAAVIGRFSLINIGGCRNSHPKPLFNCATHTHVSSVLSTHAYVIDRTLMSHYVEYLECNPAPKEALLRPHLLLSELCRRNDLNICAPPAPLALKDTLLPSDVQYGNRESDECESI